MQSQKITWVHALIRFAESKPYLVLVVAMILTNLAVYAAYFGDLSMLYRFWDGPHYAYIAKTLYVGIGEDHPFQAYGLPRTYFSSHLPLYPLLIRCMSVLTFGNYFLAMLAATTLSACVAVCLFYRLLCVGEFTKNPLWISFLFCLLPPRWVLYHVVGATEPLFLCCILGAFLAYRSNKSPWWVFLPLFLCCWTRIIGILAVGAFFLTCLVDRRWRDAIVVGLSGIALPLLFLMHLVVFGDFFVYFNWNQGQLGMVKTIPFTLYQSYSGQANYHSIEFHAWMYIIYGIGTLALWKHKDLFIYSAIMFVFTWFLFHNDIARFLLPAAPFALLIPFAKTLSLPAVRWMTPVAAYLIFIYVSRFIPANVVVEPVFRQLKTILID